MPSASTQHLCHVYYRPADIYTNPLREAERIDERFQVFVTVIAVEVVVLSGRTGFGPVGDTGKALRGAEVTSICELRE